MNAKNSLWFRLAIALWGIALAYLAIRTNVDPLSHSMTTGYHPAVAHWWAGQPVYRGPTGFNYLPAFLLLFSVFDWLPLALGELSWRFVAVAGLAVGLWRCVSLFAADAEQQVRSLALATALLLPMALSALRNGQSSAHLAACLLWAFWCIGKQRWNGAMIWLTLSLLCKPLGLPAIGLAAMAFPRLRWRALLGVAVVLLAPYLFQSTCYVNEIYADFWRNIVDCSNPGQRTFADINGVFRIVGLQVTGNWALGLSALAGLLMAALSLLMVRFDDTKISGLFWLGLTGGYIMLFTPMNELNSYVMLAPALAMWAVFWRERGEARNLNAMLLMVVTIVLLPDLVAIIFGRDRGFEFGKSWCPLLTLIFLSAITRRLCAMRSLLAPGGR